MGTRTPDIQLAKLALYQLSYTPLFAREARAVPEAGRKRPDCALPGFQFLETGACRSTKFAMMIVVLLSNWPRSVSAPIHLAPRCALCRGGPPSGCPLFHVEASTFRRDGEIPFADSP